MLFAAWHPAPPPSTVLAMAGTPCGCTRASAAALSMFDNADDLDNVIFAASTCPLRMQVLPFASDETLIDLEDNVAKVPPVSDLMARGMDLTTIAEQLLLGPGLDKASRIEKLFVYGPCDSEQLQARVLPMSKHRSSVCL
jgi:redox-regulated HSP33 family molecular chaperone